MENGYFRIPLKRGSYLNIPDFKKALNRLPEENSLVLTLHFVNKLPRKTIATQLGWSLSKVNQKITRGITLLKFEMDPGYFEINVKKPTVVSGNGSAQH